jgi:hypothetical protein
MGGRRKRRYDFPVSDQRGHPKVTLRKYQGKGSGYVMAASGRIQYDSNKKTRDITE